MRARSHKSPFPTAVFLLTALATFSVPAIGSAQATTATQATQATQETGETTARFDSLFAEWESARLGTRAQQGIADSIRALIPRLVSQEAADAYIKYRGAYFRPGEDTVALQGIEDLVRRERPQIRWDRAEDLLEAFWSMVQDSATFPESPGGSSSVMGPPHGLVPSSQVDITLEGTQASAIAGGRFGVVGTITNRRDQPVWIVDSYTTLLPPPEIWVKERIRSMRAVFPSVNSESTNDAVIRIDGLGSYVVTWQLGTKTQPVRSEDPAPTGDPAPTEESGRTDAVTPNGATSYNIMNFRPDQYRFTAQVHAWARPPVMVDGRVSDISHSEIIRGEARIEIGLPIKILLFGAIIGGLAAFATRFVHLRLSEQESVLDRQDHFRIGLLGAVVVPVIGTVLLSRLGQMDSFISLSINDLWGAMATGFLLEWLGLRRLLEPIGKETQPGAPARAEAG